MNNHSRFLHRLALALALGFVLAAGPLAPPAPAQLLPWRQQVNERMRFHEKLLLELMAQKQAAPSPAPIYMLPIPGEPKQGLPIPGEPKQSLPIEGEPKQTPPIQGEPKQPLPPGGPPKQELPLAPPGDEPQRLSIIRALAPVWRPNRP